MQIFQNRTVGVMEVMPAAPSRQSQKFKLRALMNIPNAIHRHAGDAA